MSQGNLQKQALTRLQRRVDWLTEQVGQGGSSKSVVTTESSKAASSWSELTGKPDTLLAENGDTDGFNKTQALKPKNLATALSHDPGLAGGLRKNVRASGNATDEALVTEQAIREATPEKVTDLSDVSALRTSIRDAPNATNSALATEEAIREELGSIDAAGSLSDLSDVDSAKQSDGHVLASGGSDYRNEDIASLSADHTALGDHKDAGTVSKADGQVLVGGGSSVRSEALSAATESHVNWADLSNVATSGAKNTQVGFYDTSASPSEWTVGYIADLIRERGALSIGDVSIAGTWRTIEQPSAPSTRANGDPLQEGDVWIDTDASPVAEAYVWRDNQWNKQASAIAGNNIVADAVDADRIAADTITANEITANTITAKEITADTITANEINAGTITANLINTEQLFASEGTINDFTASTAMIDEIRNNVFSGKDATISNTLQVGGGDPHILIDGSDALIESSNYRSGVSGFRVDADGSAEFESGTYRGELKSTVVRKEEVSAVGGENLITPATQLRQETVIKKAKNDGGDLVIEWAASQEVLDRDLYVKSTTQNGDNLSIEWQRRTKDLLLRDDIADVGERIRLKDAQGGGRETIATVNAKRQTDKGTLYTLDTYLTEDWPTDLAVHRWEQRIRDVSDGPFSPYRSYVDADDTEIIREGRLEGVSGVEGWGIVIGADKDLVYSTETDTLSIKGRVDATKGTIGGFDITGAGLRANDLLLSNRSDELLFIDPGSSSLNGTISNHDFTNETVGWTELDGLSGTQDASAVQTGSDSNGDFWHPSYKSPYYDRTQVEGAVRQRAIDASGFAGKEVTISVDHKLVDDAPPFNYILVLLEAPNGNFLEVREIQEGLSKGSSGSAQVKMTLPDTGLSDLSLTISARIGADDPVDEKALRIYRVTMAVGDVRTRFSEDRVEFFDSTGSLDAALDSTAQKLTLGPSGAGIVRENGEIKAIDDNGNKYTLT